MALAVGTQLFSDKSSCEVIIVRASKVDDPVVCAGAPMTTTAPADPRPAPSGSNSILLGKRYTDEASGIELLCTKAGDGPLSIGGRELTVKSPNPLPSSD